MTAERETSEEGRAEEVGVPEGVRRSGAGGLREEAMVDIVWEFEVEDREVGDVEVAGERM